jgi:hypothetical protein
MNPIRGRAALAALAVALLAACDGSNNPFRPVPPTGGGSGGAAADTVPPSADIQLPNAETPTVAVGADVFVRARVTDAVRLKEVVFEGFAVRGDPALGTDVRIERFERKTVDLTAGGRVVKDTVIDRFLTATADTVPESGVFIVVTATDTAGLVAADTFQVALGGPRVELGEPTPASPFAGTQLSVRLLARDGRDLLTSVRVTGSGSFTPAPIDLQFNPARSEIDTVLVIPIPQAAAPGTLTLTATATSGSNQTATSLPVQATIQAAAVDATAPRVTMSLAVAPRAELTDSFSVAVSATDENRVDSVGVTVLAIRQRAGGADTLRVYRGAGGVASASFRFAYLDLGLPTSDTATVDLRITAWAKDPAGNCATATTPQTPQQLPCVQGPGGIRLSGGQGALSVVYFARGRTIARPNQVDVIADLAADSSFLYLSNYSRNRVEILPLGGSTYGQPARVGAQPWGLALGRTRDSLYVANSGGTNISVIPLGAPPSRRPRTGASRRPTSCSSRRCSIRRRARWARSPSTTTATGPSSWRRRPTASWSTRRGRRRRRRTAPSASSTSGSRAPTSSSATWTATRRGGRSRSTPTRPSTCPRAGSWCAPGGARATPPTRRASPGWRRRSRRRSPACARSRPTPFGGALRHAAGPGRRHPTVGFADTTFVAASTDRRFIAVGEGVRENARIPMFEAVGDSLVLRGDVRDLISNTAERVIGLGINRDGSLGVARGDQSYFFTERLRLQGTVVSGSPTGGVAMHPENAGYPSGPQRLAFVSGIEDGRPYIDIIDTFNFFRQKRVFVRDPVVGALVVAPRAPTDPADVNLRLYALTSAGVLGLTITHADLQP